MKDKRLAMTDTLWDITRSPTHYSADMASNREPSSLARKWNTSATDQKNWNQTIKQEQWLHLGYFYLMNWRIKSSRPMRKMKHSDSIQRLCKRGDDAVPLDEYWTHCKYFGHAFVLIKRNGHKKCLAILKREFTFSVVYGVLDVLKCVGQL